MTGQPGFLGTGASLASDISLLSYILLIVPSMLVGFVFARRKLFEPHHKLTMTTIVIVNWFIIFWLMANSYRDGVLPYLNAANLGEPSIILPTIHLITGAIAQLLGTYLVIRMWFEKVLPKWVMVKKIKIYMRFTLALWLLTATLGITIYLTWYVRPIRAETILNPPATTPDVVQTQEVVQTPEMTPDIVETLEVETTPDVIFTPEVAITPELFPCVAFTPEVVVTPEIVVTPEVAITPELFPCVVITPEIAFTPEMEDDDDSGSEN